MGPFLRKYGVEAKVNFQLFETSGIDLKVDAVHASGDTKVMKDEGAEANTTNGFVDEGQGYSLTLTATEMQAARIVIYVVDQSSPKVWLDAAIVIDTYGHGSAQHAVDLDDSVRAGLTALPNAAADAAGGLPISDAGGLDLDALNTNVGDIETDTNELQTDWVNGGRLDLLIDAIKAKTDNLPADPADDSDIDAQLATIAGYLDTEVAAILADTNELQTDWVNGGRLDLLLDAVKAVTDSLTDLDTVIDAVWDEATSGHSGAGTTGKALIDASAGGSAPSAATIADAVWDEVTSGHTGAGTTGKALTDGITAGSGAITFTYTLTSSVDSSPVASATVWVTTDEAGSNVVASGTTDTSGEVVFYLDAGTYYVWREKSGWNFTNPDTETVS